MGGSAVGFAAVENTGDANHVFVVRFEEQTVAAAETKSGTCRVRRGGSRTRTSLVRSLEPADAEEVSVRSEQSLRYVDRNGLYEEDVHQGLTNALALAVGISASIAARIAGADQWTDDKPDDEPCESIWRQEPRRPYHFTSLGRRNELYAAFEASGGPEALGIFFHAQQDSFSHEGFGPDVGHLAAGFTPDKTYNDPVKADRMGQDTFERLVAAAARLPGGGYKPLDWKTISPLVQAFNRARTDKDKQRALQQILDLAQRNIEEKRRREAARRRTGACAAEFSNCEGR